MPCDGYTLVKRERLWYTVAMKALFFFSKRFIVCLLLTSLAWLVCCAPPAPETETAQIDDHVTDEDEADENVLVVPLHSSSGETWEETFVLVCESRHAAVYVSAHAIGEERAVRLTEVFEDGIYPVLPGTEGSEKPLCILVTFLEGKIYGYLQETAQGPVVCLNALYPEDLEYALAHEYQHFYAYAACKAGQTTISEETDELCSDVFCELLFPGQGRERGILSEKRASMAKERIESWGMEGLLHVYDLLREGYAEEELLSAMENR